MSGFHLSNLSSFLGPPLLHAEGHGLDWEALTGHPALFPFDVHLNTLALRQQPRLQVHRQGDQTDWVEVSTG